MNISSFLYRYPSYLTPNRTNRIDTIVIHHTGNDNDIHANTDDHMDNNAWNWLGYGYYCHNGIPLRVRGYKNQNAAVLNHNHHTVSIAVQGNYNRKIPSHADIEAVQACIYDIMEHCPNVKYLKGHRDINDTNCPGKLFPMDSLNIEPKEETVDNKYATVESVDKLREELEKMERELSRTTRTCDKLKEFIQDKYGDRIR